MNEVTGGWRKFHNEELHNLYRSPVIIRMIKSRRMRWVGHVVWMGEMRNAYNILVGKPEGKRLFIRPRHRYRMDLKEIGCENMDWIHLAQDRDHLMVLVNMVMNLWVP
jgi:hypothetical protein